MNTPFEYNIVPIAPSKTTTALGSRNRLTSCRRGDSVVAVTLPSWSTPGLGKRWLPLGGRATYRVVLRLWMVNDDGSRRLFRQQLECLGQ